MSLKAETFYAIACDFPECGELYDDGEFTYYADGPDTGSMSDAGWWHDDETDAASCPAHTIEIPCPPEGMVVNKYHAGYDDEYCQWCEDNGTDTHLALMPDTFENRLKVEMDRVVDTAHHKLDRLERDLIGQCGKLGDQGTYAQSTDRKMRAIWEQTCRDFKPDITAQELFDLTLPERKQP